MDGKGVLSRIIKEERERLVHTFHWSKVLVGEFNNTAADFIMIFVIVRGILLHLFLDGCLLRLDC